MLQQSWSPARPMTQAGLGTSLQPCLTTVPLNGPDHCPTRHQADGLAWASPHPRWGPSAPATGSHRPTGHLGRFSQHKKQKSNLEASAAVCTRHINHSLNTRARQQAGSKARTNSSLLLSHSYSKSHCDREREKQRNRANKIGFYLLSEGFK